MTYAASVIALTESLPDTRAGSHMGSLTLLFIVAAMGGKPLAAEAVELRDAPPHREIDGRVFLARAAARIRRTRRSTSPRHGEIRNDAEGLFLRLDMMSAHAIM